MEEILEADMEVRFLGVGEACDPKFGNVSMLVRTAGGQSILLDCGFTVPHRYFAAVDDPNELSMLWISHFHGDHCFGVPLLLLRLAEMKRTRRLYLVGQQGIGDRLLDLFWLAFEGSPKKVIYPIEPVEVPAGTEVSIDGTTWRTAATDHVIPDLAVRIDDGGSSLFYSGDGRPTAESSSLAEDSDTIVHEAFRIEPDYEHHGSVKGCIELARRSRANTLALVHIQRQTRHGEHERLREILEEENARGGTRVLLPEDGDTI